MTHRAAITIIIPTLGREEVLVQTLLDLLALEVRAAEIIVVDQTPQHAPATVVALAELVNAGDIILLHRSEPSITAAMNAGLTAASQPVVLFLDDDIRPDATLVQAHAHAHELNGTDVIAAGRVIQPWEEGITLPSDEKFRFAGTAECWISEFMGGNFSVDRRRAMSLGGFDENFVRVAYRFEAEFAHRWCESGGRIRFVPDASLHHLKAGGGGTRTFGEHLTTSRPDHSVGAYYFALRTGGWLEFLRRPLRSIATRYHLRRPWRMAPTLLAELRGAAWAWRLYRDGPRLLSSAPMGGA